MNDRTGRTACSLEPGIRIPRPFWRGTKPGNSVAEKIPAKKWAIIKHARSGSNLFRQWNPGKTSQDKQGEEYVKLIRTVRNGMEALKKQGHAPVLKAMVWQQGEGDARDIAGIKNALSYGANLNNLIKRIRADLEAPGLAFIYGSVLPVPAPARFPGREEVRQGQKDVAEESRTSLSVNNAVYVPADDLQLRSVDFRTPYPTDTVHLGTHGILALGERFASALEKLWRQKTDTPDLFSSPLSPAPPATSGKPIMFDIPPGCG